MFTHSFPDDGRQVSEVLLRAFETGNHDELNALEGAQAQVALDAMQEVRHMTLFCYYLLNRLDQILHHWQLDDHSDLDPALFQEARWLLLRRLQKLSCDASLLPSHLYIKGVECKDRESLGNGGFADVYRGSHNGDTVAVKNLRTFKMVKLSEEANMKRVRLIPTHRHHYTNLLPVVLP